MLLAAFLVIAVVAPSSADAAGERAPRVTLAFLPNGTGIRALGAVEGISPGAMSAGLGNVPAGQTYLDISQGGRIFGSLYDFALPNLFTIGGRVPPRIWAEVTERAADAPADIVPGLLASTLASAEWEGREGGIRARADRLAGLAGLSLVDRQGRVFEARGCVSRTCEGVTVISTRLRRLPHLVGRLRAEDLLIAMERPPPEAGHLLSAGIAGSGFDGLLTSDGTRRPGLVLSTDVAPTILERYGIQAPTEMSGSAIRTEGEPDPDEVASLEHRLAVVQPRRGPVVGTNLLIWAALALIAAVAFRDRGARVALVLLALSAIYLPALLLVGAALEPSEGVERLLVGAGAPILAGITAALVGGYGAVAIACAVTVLAYAVDVVAGSPLTATSLIGPNPALGVRFYGIGNELEATLAPLVLIGAGSGLAALAGRPAWRRAGRQDPLAAGCFALAALGAAAVFAPGRFGADVGAAVVLAVGGAVAVAVVLQAGRRRLAVMILGVPVLALAALAAVDLMLGGDAHLSRSVLEAGGLEEVGEVAERRLRLSASSFARMLDSPFLIIAVGTVAAGIGLRHRVASWFEGRSPAWAGFLGAVAAIAVGTLANDSGALLLIIGTAYVALFAGFAWATREGAG
jgi:hypothetical protein